MAGYSKTPLAKKLGIRPNVRVRTKSAPKNYRALLDPLPDDVVISPRLKGTVDICHLFVEQKAGLSELLLASMRDIPDNGMIWVSWPKRASGVTTDMTENEVRRAALPLGLVDVKVCAVDEIWSALKLMIRRSMRK